MVFLIVFSWKALFLLLFIMWCYKQLIIKHTRNKWGRKKLKALFLEKICSLDYYCASVFVIFSWLLLFRKKCRYMEWQKREKNYFGTDTKCHYREFDFKKIRYTEFCFTKTKRERKADRRKTDVIANLTLLGVTLYGVSTVPTFFFPLLQLVKEFN